MMDESSKRNRSLLQRTLMIPTVNQVTKSIARLTSTTRVRRSARSRFAGQAQGLGHFGILLYSIKHRERARRHHKSLLAFPASDAGPAKTVKRREIFCSLESYIIYHTVRPDLCSMTAEMSTST